jgi:endonuclease/exonuclease/phosphatase (EEP) superfamily protein YafD
MSILDLAQYVRQHHALEHATINLLGRRYPYLSLAGRSTHVGFHIYGRLATEEVASAASEGLVRLQQGEAYLAYHPRCGTNLAVTSLLAGTAAFGATLGRPRSKLERLPLALSAATVAALVSRPLADRIQQWITTTPEVDGLYIADVTRHEQGRFVVHKVRIGRE